MLWKEVIQFGNKLETSYLDSVPPWFVSVILPSMELQVRLKTYDINTIYVERLRHIYKRLWRLFFWG